jgi:hypothetical protein
MFQLSRIPKALLTANTFVPLRRIIVEISPFSVSYTIKRPPETEQSELLETLIHSVLPLAFMFT